MRRLLLPLVFGILVIVPPQVYLERHCTGQFAGSFLRMAAAGLRRLYPTATSSWNHLWFVGYVLILTFVLLPVYPVGAHAERPARRRPGWRAVMASATGLHWLMAVPLAASIICPVARFRTT